MVCIMIIGYKCHPIRDIGQHEKESGFSSDYEKKGASSDRRNAFVFHVFIIHCFVGMSTVF